MRVVVTGRLSATNPRTFIETLSNSDEIDLYIITDSTNYAGLPSLDQEKIYNYTPTWPEPISRFYPHDKRVYNEIIDEINPDIMLSLGISNLIFMSSTINFTPAVLLPQGGETSRAMVSPYWTHSRLKKLYYRFLYRPLFKELVRHVDEVWTTKPNKNVFTQLGLAEDHFRNLDWVVVDTEQFYRRTDSVEFVEEPDTTVIGTFRRIRGHKLIPSYETLIDAAAQLADRDCDFHVVVGGLYPDKRDSMVEQKIDEKVEEHGLGNSITKIELVPKSELPRYYSGLDVYINPTHHNLALGGIGTAAKEAMACECAIISFDDVKNDSIKQGENGFVLPHGDSKALADHLEMLCKNSEKRNEMGKAGRKTVANNSPERVAEKVRTACEQVLQPY